MPDLDLLIDQKVQKLMGRFDHTKPRSAGRIMVLFLDKLPQLKKKSSWFGKGDSQDDAQVWETWVINAVCFSHNVVHSPSVQSFERCLYKILSLVDEHKDHIPLITSLDSAPFLYTIKVDTEEPSEDSWGKYIKKILD